MVSATNKKKHNVCTILVWYFMDNHLILKRIRQMLRVFDDVFNTDDILHAQARLTPVVDVNIASMNSYQPLPCHRILC